MGKYLDSDGLGYFWGKIKAYVQQQIQAIGAITGVKGDAESTYRTGNVNLTPANLGIIDFTGATDSTAGAGGLVPAPSAQQQRALLLGDGSWHIPATSVTANASDDTLTVNLLDSPNSAIATFTLWPATQNQPGLMSTENVVALDGKADTADLGDLAYLDEVPNHSTAKLTSGTLGVARGGTGKASHTVNSILTGGTTTTGAIQDVATASGALYATSANGAASFGTLPIAQGGTGKTSAADAWDALGGGSIGKKDSLAASDIPSLAASKITSGTFNAARIPSLNTSKLTAGTLGVARGGTGFSAVTSKLDNTNATIYVWGKLVMVQLHGQTKTPDGTAIWSTAYLADYKPGYNASAIVAATTGELARVWVGASDGKIYLSAVNTSTSKAWYGTLIYMLA